MGNARPLQRRRLGVPVQLEIQDWLSGLEEHESGHFSPDGDYLATDSQACSEWWRNTCGLSPHPPTSPLTSLIASLHMDIKCSRSCAASSAETLHPFSDNRTPIPGSPGDFSDGPQAPSAPGGHSTWLHMGPQCPAQTPDLPNQSLGEAESCSFSTHCRGAGPGHPSAEERSRQSCQVLGAGP